MAAVTLLLLFVLFATFFHEAISIPTKDRPLRSFHRKKLQHSLVGNAAITHFQSTNIQDIQSENDTTKKEKSAHDKQVLLVSSLIYGSTYVVTKKLQDLIPSEMITFMRFFIAFLCLLPSMISQWTSIPKEVIFIGLELGIWCGIGFMFQALTLQTSSASKSALFTSMGVIVPPLIELFCKPLHPMQKKENVNQSILSKVISSPFLSPVIAVIGAAIIEWGGIDAPHLSDLLLLVPPVCFAMNFWRSERTAVNYPQYTPTITGLMLLITSIISGLWALKKGLFPISINDWSQFADRLVSKNKFWPLLMIILLGTIATAWTAVSEQEALKVLSANETVLVYATEPIFAALFAMIFLKEEITRNFVVGASLIVMACLLH